MKYKRHILLFFCAGLLNAQVLTWTPQFAVRSDTITIVYDATLGSGGLAGSSEVYAHTGVITDKSATPVDWRYVKTAWGQNTEAVRLTGLGNDLWQLKMHIESYYGVPAEETIEQLAFVFRNASSSRTGRAADNGDLYIPVYLEGLQVALTSPALTPVFGQSGDTLRVSAAGSNASRMSLSVDGVPVYEVDSDTLVFTLHAAAPGRREVTVAAYDQTGAVKETGFGWIINPEVTIAPLPAGTADGITVTGASEAVLSLYAPGKEFVYVIGSFNDWKCGLEGFMNLAPDSSRWWLQLRDLDPDSVYTFQYFVDGNLRVADPYTELVLDPWNDRDIPQTIYAGFPRYPEGETREPAGSFHTRPDTFDWGTGDYQRPEPSSLVIYELLLRDFLEQHDYATLIDTLDYLQHLGVTAVELMPVNEFEGNSSWGYNPAFYFAPDKYYGPAADLKRFVKEAHNRGMAVILDMVLNHAFGQCPLVRLYWDDENSRPSAANPWFNDISPNPVYSWGYDFNHESEATRYFADRVLSHWVREYGIDGYRLDFTKGFTNTPGDGWAYDGRRIAVLKRLADELWTVDSTAYIILEHFAENTEEKVLADYGFLIWGNMNTAYSQSAMGWLNDSGRSSDLSRGYYKNRGWSRPGLITYMESHDEPWLTYKNLQYGRSAGGYSIQSLPTALERYALAAAFFFTIPGPKMMWQFGELGYDVYLPESGHERTAPKPPRWDYFQDLQRRRLYDTIAALNSLRAGHALFRTPETSLTMHTGQNQYDRWLHLANDTMRATVMGNFDVTARSVRPVFQNTGIWYDYFSGDSLTVLSVDTALMLQPGEYRIYLDRPQTRPLLTSVDEDPVPESVSGADGFMLHHNYPNPFNSSTVISFSLARESETELRIVNLLGRTVAVPLSGRLARGGHRIEWNAADAQGQPLPSGVYIIRLRSGDDYKTDKMLLLR